MGLIKEPLDIDFVVDPRRLTEVEKNAISQYIRDYKIIKKKQAVTPKNKVDATKRAFASNNS